jgi:putative ABC transport system permease protein
MAGGGMNLVGLALRNLRRRPIRTCLSILGVGLAVGSALALIALSRSIKDSTQEGMNEMGDDLVVMQKGASDIFGGFIPEQMVARIAAIPGVVRVSGVAVLGEAAAASLGKKLGDELELLGQGFRVIGIANYTTIVNRGIVLVPLIDLQEASYRTRQVTMIHVNVDRSGGPGELSRVRTSIEALGNLTASTTNEVLNNDRNFAILEAVSLAVSIIALAIGALNVLTALVMAIQERTREIGIFGAIGWSSPRIITSIVIEGVLMCAIGCILGALLSFAVALVFPNIPGIGDLISFKPRVAVIAPILVAAFALCILGSLLPAWRAVRLVPADALRRL